MKSNEIFFSINKQIILLQVDVDNHIYQLAFSHALITGRSASTIHLPFPKTLISCLVIEQSIRAVLWESYSSLADYESLTTIGVCIVTIRFATAI